MDSLRKRSTDLNFVCRVPRPKLDCSYVFGELLRTLYAIKTAKYTELTGYDDLNFKLSECIFEDGCNNGGSVFTLKLVNPWETQFYPALCEAQAELANLMAAGGIPCPQLIRTRDRAAHGLVRWAEAERPILLRSFVPGTLLGDWVASHPYKCNLDNISHQIGSLLGHFHAICDMHNQTIIIPHAVFRHYAPLLSLEHWLFHRREFELQKRELGEKMIGLKRAKLCEQIFEEFEHKVLARREHFEHAVIHGDFNESNLLVDQKYDDGDFKISSLIDFGDSHFSFRVADLANAILYLYLLWRETHQNDCDEHGELLRRIAKSIYFGYSKSADKSFSAHDLAHLGLFIRARLVISLVNGLRALRMSNGKNGGGGMEYVLKTQQIGQKVLEEMGSADYMDSLIITANEANGTMKGH